jgi:hypothetical protein
MSATLPVLVLLLTPLVMFTIRLVKPDFNYYWLVATTGALITWPITILLGFQLPKNVLLMPWKPETLFPASPSLLLDNVSWPYMFALATLALAVILTAAARLQHYHWRTWAYTLLLAGLGMLAVLSGNLLTLLLAWAAIDLVELAILLVQVLQSSDRERVVVSFSVRVAGIMLLLWAGVVGAPGDPFVFTDIPQDASLYLLLAAGLRLGVLPLHIPRVKGPPLRRGFGSMLRLAPLASNLVLLTRAAAIGIPQDYQVYLLALCGLASLYGSLGWLTSKDELAGRPFWVLGMAALAVASAAKGRPEASQAWGLACILSGGLLFLSSARYRGLLVIFLLSGLGLTTLPYTPAWDGSYLYTAPIDLFLPIFLVGHALLLTGFLRHSLGESSDLSLLEPWVRTVYPFGLGLLPLGHLFIAWRTPLPTTPTGNYAEWWAGIVAIGITALIVYLGQNEIQLPSGIATLWDRIFSLNWVSSLIWGVYRSVGKFISTLSKIAEGEGGLLWAMVLSVILLSLLVQSGLGGS